MAIGAKSMPFGVMDGYTTYVSVHVRGRRLEGERTLTNLTLKERPKSWRFWKLPRWRRGPTRLDLVGDAIAKLRKDGLSLGDSDSPPIVMTVVMAGNGGHFLLSDRWRVIPWGGSQSGVPKRLTLIEVDN